MPYFTNRGITPLSSAGPTGLISYWPMNESSGTTVTDTISGYNGTVSSGSLWVSDGLGLSTGTDGTRVADVSAFNLGTAFTAFGWIKADAQDALGIFAQYDFGSAQRAWGIFTTLGGQMRAVVSDDGSSAAGHMKNYTGSQTLLNIALWNSFAIRFNSGTFDLFVNGAIDSSPTKTTDPAITTVFNSTADLTHGCVLFSGAIDSAAVGVIQRFRLYNTALADADITALHALGHV